MLAPAVALAGSSVTRPSSMSFDEYQGTSLPPTDPGSVTQPEWPSPSDPAFREVGLSDAGARRPVACW